MQDVEVNEEQGLWDVLVVDPLLEGGGGRKESQSTRLVRLARAAAEFWHSTQGEAYATVDTGYRQHLRIRSAEFRDWLANAFWQEEGKVPSRPAMEAALAVLEGEARFRGREREVFVRVGWVRDRLYLDLADKGLAVVVDASGWRLVKDPEVCFLRPRGMLPLPRPVAGGSLQLLRRYVNARGEEDWVLMVSWLLGALHPRGPYPALMLTGQQGSAKTFTARVLRAVIDPAVAGLRAPPADERDLAIAASNSWVLAYDNLSTLPVWLSDALCRLLTGSGLATRKLYSDSDEVLFESRRPVLLTGIEDLAVAADLRDRAILLELPPLAEEDRRPEAELWEAFERDRPAVLGALLDAVAEAIRQYAETRLDALPRMADFAKWVAAAEGVLPWPPGTFLRAFRERQRLRSRDAVSDDPLAAALVRLATEGAWQGTATELLEYLARAVPSKYQRAPYWPAVPQALSARLRRLAPDLRSAGVEVAFFRMGGTGQRVIDVRKVG